MTLIETKTLGTAAAAIEFTSIPSDGTDLLVFCSLRTTNTFGVGGVTWFDVKLSVNSNTSNLSNIFAAGNGSSSSSGSGSGEFILRVSDSATTANTFANSMLYFTNYAGATTKSIALDSVSETNATNARQEITIGLWNDTTAISSLSFSPSSGNLAIGSTISLYKITKGTDGIVVVS